MSLTIQQVRQIFSEFGFVESEAAGLFRWYEFPSARVVREEKIYAYVRAMFYEPRSELQIWVNSVGPGLRAKAYQENMFQGQVDTDDDVYREISRMVAARQMRAVAELVSWSDDRLPPHPELIAVAHSPAKSESRQALILIRDWLLERGIPF